MTRLLVSSVIAAMIVSCGGAGAPAAPAATQAGIATLTITSPKAGATVPSGDVTVTYEVTNVTLVPAASAQKPEDYHVHAFLDIDPSNYVGTDIAVPAGDQNPDPTRLIHTAAKTVTFKDVGPGEHNLTVFMTFSNHVSVKPPVSATVKFTTR